jgi:prepilin-type N-terminal cleavage/methylation domain-containing protein
MKKTFTRLRLSKLSSFTLVELLVVIGIIAILASVILSAGTSALKAAMRAKALNMATQLQTACLGYYTEYSVYPVPANTTTDYTITDTDFASWGNLIQALCGNIKPSTGGVATPNITNSRGIAFLSLKSSDVDSHDAPLNALPTTTQIYFNIAMDSDYDGILGAGGAGSSTAVLPKFSATPWATTGGTSTAGVAVWANCNGVATSTNGNYWVHTY